MTTTMNRMLCLTLVALIPLASARADEITLKGGKRVYGTILQETSKRIIILTMRGKERISQSKVESVIENAAFGDKVLDARIEKVDPDDPDAIASVAEWAKKAGHRGWKMVAHKAKNMAPDNDTANELLGYTKVGDTWFKDKKEAAKAKKELMTEEMKANGYVYLKKGKQGGWVKKEDKKLVMKSFKDWMVDEDMIWKPKKEVMSARGYVEMGGKWIKASPQDLEEMKLFEEVIGDKIMITTTEHFRLHVQQYPMDKIQEFGELAEKIYAWFLKEMNKEEDFPLFRSTKGKIWIFKDKTTALDWYKHWKNRLSLSDTFGTLLTRGGGNIVSPGKPLGIITPNQSQDIRNRLAHQVGHFCIAWFSPGLKGTPDWLGEAFGHMAEHVHLGTGAVNCSTLAKYGGGGGMAEKEFNTKDAPERAKGIVRDESDDPFETLNKIDLNNLTGDHLTKGYTLILWLLKQHHDELVNWLQGMNTAKSLDALAKAFGGWTGAELDKRWREYVKKNF